MKLNFCPIAQTISTDKFCLTCVRSCDYQDNYMQIIFLQVLNNFVEYSKIQRNLKEYYNKNARLQNIDLFRDSCLNNRMYVAPFLGVAIDILSFSFLYNNYIYLISCYLNGNGKYLISAVKEDENILFKMLYACCDLDSDWINNKVRKQR